MAVTAPTSDTLPVRLDRLFIPDNVRDELDEARVERHVRSINARGKIISAIKVINADPLVHGDAYDYVLVAGNTRVEAARRLGHETVPGEYGDPEYEHIDRAIENIVRDQLNPREEAIALREILDRGLSDEGAAEMLGWDLRRVSVRRKLLALPERAQQLVGDRTIALSAVDAMGVIARANPALLGVVTEYIDSDPENSQVDQLARRPLSVLRRALSQTESDVFAGPLREVPLDHLDLLELDNATVAMVAEATRLNDGVRPRMRFTDAEVDRARAAGVLLEHGDEEPLVTDFAVYQDLCRTAIATGVEALSAQVGNRGAVDKLASADTPADPFAELATAHRREIRRLTVTAHSANLDLGDSLRDHLSVVDPNDMTVARFFVYALLGEQTTSIYGDETCVSAIARRGIGLVIGEFRQDKTKTKKGGGKGALRIDYGDGRDYTGQARWLWRYLEGAQTAGELYGRALVIMAAEHYASRLVLPASQQGQPLSWVSHNDIALKALEKLARPHLAPTLKALQRAVAKAAKAYDEAREALLAAPHDPQQDDGPAAPVAVITDENPVPETDSHDPEPAAVESPAPERVDDDGDPELGSVAEPGEQTLLASELTDAPAADTPHPDQPASIATAAAERGDQLAAGSAPTPAPTAAGSHGDDITDHPSGDVVDASEDIAF